MPDQFQNFAALSAECHEGLDYRIHINDRGGRVLVFSPHAGGIEPGTSELVRAIAAADISCYLFEGIRAAGNTDLHITSHHFDEPRCLELIGRFETSLAIHGYNKREPMIYLGGTNEWLKQSLKQVLPARFPLQDTNENSLDGRAPLNICNRTASRAGVQLEFSTGARRQLFENWEHTVGRQARLPVFFELVAAIRQALLS